MDISRRIARNTAYLLGWRKRHSRISESDARGRPRRNRKTQGNQEAARRKREYRVYRKSRRR